MLWPRSETQARVLLAALWAWRGLGRAARRNIKRGAPGAAEGCAPAQGFEARAVPAFIPKPKPGEEQAGERAPEQRAGGEIKHARSPSADEAEGNHNREALGRGP